MYVDKYSHTHNHTIIDNGMIFHNHTIIDNGMIFHTYVIKKTELILFANNIYVRIHYLNYFNINLFI